MLERSRTTTATTTTIRQGVGKASPKSNDLGKMYCTSVPHEMVYPIWPHYCYPRLMRQLEQFAYDAVRRSHTSHELHDGSCPARKKCSTGRVRNNNVFFVMPFARTARQLNIKDIFTASGIFH